MFILWLCVCCSPPPSSPAMRYSMAGKPWEREIIVLWILLFSFFPSKGTTLFWTTCGALLIWSPQRTRHHLLQLWSRRMRVDGLMCWSQVTTEKGKKSLVTGGDRAMGPGMEVIRSSSLGQLSLGSHVGLPPVCAASCCAHCAHRAHRALHNRLHLPCSLAWHSSILSYRRSVSPSPYPHANYYPMSMSSLFRNPII